MRKTTTKRLAALRACLDEYAGRYATIAGAADFAAYVGRKPAQADEEILTEPILDSILRRLLEARIRECVALVTALLAEGRRLVEEVERLVCALYGLPDDLTAEVVAHAVRRAGGPA